MLNESGHKFNLTTNLTLLPSIVWGEFMCSKKLKKNIKKISETH